MYVLNVYTSLVGSNMRLAEHAVVSLLLGDTTCSNYIDCGC